MRQRVVGWEERLLAVLDKHRTKPFCWEASNCGNLMADVVEALRGEPGHISAHLGGFKSARGAAKKIRTGGFESLSQLVAHGLDETPVSFAQRGDLCIIEVDGVEYGGCIVDGVGVGKAEAGLMRVELSLVKRAFEV
jgi:hypothetical protein